MTTRSVRFSLRTKILLLLNLVVMFSIVVYILFAVDLFLKDKQAYIFESSMSAIESNELLLADFIRGAIKNGLPLAVVSKTEPEQLQKLVVLDKDILSFSVLKQESESLSEKIKIQNKKLFETLKVDPTKITTAIEQLYPVEKVGEDGVYTFNASSIAQTPAIGIITQNKSSEEYYITYLSLARFLDQLNKNSIYENYLLNLDGTSYLTSLEKPVAYINAVTTGTTTAGTNQAVNTKNKEVLYSFKKMSDFKMIILSEIEKEKAFMATSLLIKKSIIFGALLLSIAVFLGVLLATSIMKPLRELLYGTEQISSGDFKYRLDIKQNDELGVLSDSFNFMSAKVAELMSQTDANARMEKELETAKTVQETLFPKDYYHDGKWEIAGFFTPAGECGGDWWYYVDTGDKLYLCIADATGHGVPAALITAAACSAVAIIEYLPNITPKHALSLLNSSIYQSSKGKILMTFFFATLDKKTGELKYSNASHNPPFHFPYNDKDLNVKSMTALDGEPGIRLGEQRVSEYEEHSIMINEGEAIIFYTDGLTELENKEGKQWGERKFLKALISATQESTTTKKSISFLYDKVNEYRGEHPLKDDVTYFLLRREVLS